MGCLISIDPGVNHHGVAYFTDGKLKVAWFSLSEEVLEDIAWHIKGEDTLDQLAIEIPQVYVPSLFDPNDLINLAVEAGKVIGVLEEDYSVKTTTYLPKSWKKQVPKDIMNRRTLARLSEKEKAAIQWPIKSRRHNVLDAAGVGLHHLGRLK